MQMPEIVENELWCKCIICVEYFVSTDEQEHKESYEHNKRIASYGEDLPEYIFAVRELPVDCAPYYTGEMPTEAELQIEFHCAINNLHEFEVDIDYFTKKLDELGGDISDMKKLLDRIEKISASDELKKSTVVYDTSGMHDQIRKMNGETKETKLWRDENIAWNLKNQQSSDTQESNHMNLAHKRIEQDYIDSCILNLAIEESKENILKIEQERIQKNFLESLFEESPSRIQKSFDEDELLALSDDNIEFEDFIDFDTEDFDSDN